MNYKMLLVLFLIFGCFHTADAALTLCRSSQECGLNELCTAELMDCTTSECIGSCQQKNSATLSLNPTINLKEAFVTQNCTTNTCESLLWISLTEGISKELLAGTNITIELFSYQKNNDSFSSIFTAVKPLLSANNTIKSFSITLPEKTLATLYPFSQFYELHITYNLETFTWLIRTDVLNANGLTEVTVSSVNPSTAIKTKFVQTVPTVIKNSIQFSDVYNNTELATALEYLTSANIVQGYDDGTFRPLQFINRAEAAKLLLIARYGSINVMPTSNIFSDVENFAWYTPYVLFASSKNIVNGYSDGTFKPNATINTAEFLKILTNTFEVNTNLTYSFVDVPANAWFAPFAGIAEYAKLFPNRPSYALYPAMKMTRQDFAIALYKILQNNSL